MTTTKDNKSLHALSAKQLKAIAVLSSGGTHEEAAAAAQTHRVTVTRWTNHHPAFIAELNRLKEEAISTFSSEILGVTNAAVRVVSRALESDDSEIALRWLRLALPVVGASAAHPKARAIDSRAVVEEHRQGMPSAFEDGLQRGFERSTLEAEADILDRLNP